MTNTGNKLGRSGHKQVCIRRNQSPRAESGRGAMRLVSHTSECNRHANQKTASQARKGRYFASRYLPLSVSPPFNKSAPSPLP